MFTFLGGEGNIMTTDRWSGVLGDWSNPFDWSTGSAPDPTDEAVLAAPGSYTVTVATPDTAGSVVLNDPGATLDIQSGGTLAVGGSVVVQSGAVDIQGSGFFGGGTLAIGGALTVQSG